MASRWWRVSPGVNQTPAELGISVGLSGGSLQFLTDQAVVGEMKFELLGDRLSDLFCWINLATMAWVITARHAQEAFTLRSSEHIQVATDLDRFQSDTRGDRLQSISGRNGPEGTLLLLYEQGLLCLEEDASVRWHSPHNYFSALFSEIGDDAVCIEAELGDEAALDRTCYSMNDGRALGFFSST
jgi:hypothetical protein